MSTDLGGPGTAPFRSAPDPSPAAPSARPPVPPVPPAVRARPPGWRDPRLWVGVALVAGSVVAGSRLLAGADDTVGVWGAAADIPVGERLTEDDLAVQRVRFADVDDLARYFTTADELPADLVLTREVAAGELVPRAALGPAGDGDTVELPVAVPPERVPGSVTEGSVVDVYVLPGREPALAEARVVDAPAPEQTFGTSGLRQLVLAVDEPDARRFFGLLGSTDTPVITVVRRG